MDIKQHSESSACVSGAKGHDGPAARPERPTAGAATSLYVGNLHSAVDEAMLLDVFSTIGHVEEVKVCIATASMLPLPFPSIGMYNQQPNAKQ